MFLPLYGARRFAGYKRAELLTRDLDRFNALLANRNILFRSSGKPYPVDYPAIKRFQSSGTPQQKLQKCCCMYWL